MSRRANETEPGSSFSNPIWHEGFRIYSWNRLPEYSYEFVGEDEDCNTRVGHTSTIAGAKTKIDQLLGKAKPL